MKKRLGLLFLLLLPLGCSVNFKKPTTRLMSPEVIGQTLGGEVAVELAGTANIKMIKEPLTATPSTNPNIDEAQDFGLKLHVGASSFLDIYNEATLEGPYVSGLKLQFFGDSLANSKQGSWSASVFGGLLWGTIKDEQKENAGQSNEIVANSKIKASGYEGGVIVGYRVFEEALIYLTGNHSVITANANLDQVNSGVATNDLVDVDGEGVIQAAGVGFVLGKKLFLQGEGVYVIGKWKRTTTPEVEAEDLKNFMFGTNMGLHW
ncbi:MAG: hypothetical protein KDD34_05905 [Bdellovibrionales bacterium]|nr:hypothetical protein [Bdellovibrionales bacterium]